MNAKEKWNLIVDQYQVLRNQREEKVQRAWEDYFSEFFGYRKLLGEIDSQRNITIGSSVRTIPDIILRKDKKDLLDVELKQYNLPFKPEMEQQLKSYLKLLGLTVGLLICEKIYVCHLVYDEDQVYKWSIPFEKDNPDGIELMDLLNKETFSQKAVSDFIDTRIKTILEAEEIKKDLTADYVTEIVRDFYESQQYSKEAVAMALKEFIFKVERKSHKATPPLPPPPPLPTDFSLSPKFMIIKTHWERVALLKSHFNCSDKEALYHATRHAWRVTYDKAMRYDYVLAVIDKKVQEVYKVGNWKLVSQENGNYWGLDLDGEKAIGRYEFWGEVAPDNIRALWVGKRIPFQFMRMGLASPVLYSDQKSN